MTVGWYVHHHGGGHLARFLAVRPHLDDVVVCFSSLPRPAALPPRTEWVQLERDDTDDGRVPVTEARPTASGLLHWAPLGHAGHRSRLATIAARASSDRFAALVVDVSIEVVLLARLLGVPPVVVAQPGDRVDEPHALAYRAAEAIVAPWPGGLASPPHLGAVAEKVVAVGGISRFAGREREASTIPGSVLVLAGRGGSLVTSEQVRAAAAATPGRQWSALGIDAWLDDPWPAITAAETVVSWAGQNAIADLAAAGSRAVVIPQERPFGEQRATAAVLVANALAAVESGWPEPELWPAVLQRAARLDADWARWRTDGAAERAAAVVAATAERWRP